MLATTSASDASKCPVRLEAFRFGVRTATTFLANTLEVILAVFGTHGLSRFDAIGTAL